MRLLEITPDQAKGITDQELFERISSDHLDYSEWRPNPSWFYVGVADSDNLIGYFMLHSDSDNTLSIHINIIKEHRKKAKEAAHTFLKFFDENFNEAFQKLTCKIPVIYPEVRGFCLSVGFEDEGLCKCSIMKNGKLVDRHIMGLKRSKIKEVA